MRGNRLVDRYRDHQALRAAILHADRLIAFPTGPFDGELGYADHVWTMSE